MAKRTPERQLKARRLQWIDMLEQLRFGSPSASEILPGQCQDMLDFLVLKYMPIGTSLPRHETHGLKISSNRALTLHNLLPDEKWARKSRPPHDYNGHPIFYRLCKNIYYLDGRRRINAYAKKHPNKIIKYWLIYEI